VYSDRVGGVVIPFPQRVRAPVVQLDYVGAQVLWPVRAMRAARAVQANAGEAIVAALIVVMMAGDAWLLAAAFGVSL